MVLQSKSYSTPYCVIACECHKLCLAETVSRCSEYGSYYFPLPNGADIIHGCLDSLAGLHLSGLDGSGSYSVNSCENVLSVLTLPSVPAQTLLHVMT